YVFDRAVSQPAHQVVHRPEGRGPDPGAIGASSLPTALPATGRTAASMSLGETYLTVLGWIGSEPDFKEIRQIPQPPCRLGSPRRPFDRTRNTSIDKPTTWYTVQCWRGLAQNAFESVRVGQPVIVTGRLRTHEWTNEAGEQRSRVVLEAFTLGHDLTR